MLRRAISASFWRRRCFSSDERVRGSIVKARRKSSSINGGVPVLPADALPESCESLPVESCEWQGECAGSTPSWSEFASSETTSTTSSMLEGKFEISSISSGSDSSPTIADMENPNFFGLLICLSTAEESIIDEIEWLDTDFNGDGGEPTDGAEEPPADGVCPP